MDIDRIPLKLKSTRAWRTYTGGQLLEQWLGESKGEDGEFPEDWIASVTPAAYGPGGQESTDDGLSIVNNPGDDTGKVYLKDLIDREPEYYLGTEHVKKYKSSTALLTKMIDSAERLTIQVHPDNATAQALFNSRFGKTEAWYILGGRVIDGEKPYVLLGFKKGVTREKWKALFDTQDIDGMIDALHRFDIEPGQVFLLEGGTPHAIGPGCFLVEIQEPTDLTLRSEKISPKGREIPDHLCHLGLGFDKMFDCFNYETYTKEEISDKYMLKPVTLSESEAYTEKALIGYEHTPCFKMTVTEINDSAVIKPESTFSAAVVTEGEGILYCEGEEISIMQGEQLFFPAGLDYEIECKRTGRSILKIIRCFPPK